MSLWSHHIKLGILGGGQLGKMLIQECVNFAVTPVVLGQYEEGPCRPVCSNYEIGELTDYETVYEFGQQVDVLTIEIENVNTQALQDLADEGLPVYPQPKVIETVQDKGLQKQFYRDQEIPTADFHLIENHEEISKYSDFLPAVQKIRKGGYDGRGVQKITSTAEIESGFDQPSVLEKLVSLKAELSVIVARSPSGQVQPFPPVEMKFNPEENLVEYLFAPTQVKLPLQKRARQVAVSVAETLEIVGIVAVELFVSEDNEVYVNEIAPRPHNSGHQTIEANVTSQYEQLTRAILDLPLGDPSLKHPSVMVNILGDEGEEGPVQYEGLTDILDMEGTHVHLYGKKTTYPYRKMGHVTVVDNDLEKAIETANFVQNIIKVKAL